jgi:hypothetical protein
MILCVGLAGVLPGCGLLITAAQMSGKMPSTEAVVNAAVRTARALTAAQPEIRTIASGEAATGTLTDEHERLEDGSYFATWFYTGSKGETVQIDLWSDDFEPYLILGFMEGGMEGSFEQLAATGEAGAGAQATLSLRLERSGLYAIVVNTVEAAQTGSYRLRVMANESGPAVLDGL